MNGKWVIGIGLAAVVAAAGVACAAPAVARNEQAPAQVVTAFYDWYLGRANGQGASQNPLASGAYRDSEYLTAAFVAEVDETVTGFDKGGYDPFLMAQDVPQSVTVGEAVVKGDEAWVPVTTDFEGHGLTVALEHLDGRWQIAGIALAPETVVRSFYGWYLGYIGHGEEMRNPLVDGAYRDCGYLSPAFEGQIEATLASFDKGGFDPILLAQDVPERVEVGAAVLLGDRANVRVQLFWGNNSTPSERTVNLVLAGGSWQIDGVSR